MTYILAYPVKIEESEGEQIIRFPDFPEALTTVPVGENPYPMAQDCLSEAMASRILNGEDIDISRLPSGDGKNQIPPDEMIGKKAILHQCMRDADWTTARLARELGVDHKEARRILDPRHNTKYQRFQDAIFAVNRMVFVVGLQEAG